jgi:alpha-tubulin suppressor-like RCC1 family protein
VGLTGLGLSIGGPPSFGPAGAADRIVTNPVTPRPAGASLPSQALYSWGSNDWGQLGAGSSGEGTPTPVVQPAAVAAPAGVHFRTVAGGGAHSLGLSTTGQVYSWGADFSGQLGLGSTGGYPTPQAVGVPGGPVSAVAAGSVHSLALTASGQIYAWGANLFGQLGNGTASDAHAPVLVAAPSGVTFTAIAAGGDHSLALSSTGQVYAWGANFSGQLGTGTTRASSTPVVSVAPAGVTFTAIAAGTSHNLALSTTGQIYAWGFNASGQLGNGTNASSLTMTPVSMPGGATATGIATGGSHSLALTTTGQVYEWGSDVYGQLDTLLVGSLPIDSFVPIQPLGLPPLTTFVSVAGGLDSSYALTSAGVPWVWGGNVYGQLGVGTPGLDGVLPAPLDSLTPGTLATGVFTGPDSTSAFVVSRSVQPLVFPAMPSATYGDAPVSVAPTVGSGMPITTTATGSCSGPLVRLLLTGAGLCTVTAAQDGDFWFYPATGTANFTVVRAPLTITPASATGHIGAPVPSLGYSLAGYRNHDPSTVVSGRASCTTTATYGSPRGTYPITCGVGTLSAANYYFVPSGTAVLTLLTAASGYVVVGRDGAVWALGPARVDTAPAPPFYGSMAGHPLNAPVVGAAFTPLHDGYWLVASDGGIFAFGSAGFHGSMGGRPLNRPIVGLAATPDGKGYWEVASDGGIFAFGDAPFFGSTGSITLNRPIVGMTATADGRGYWMVASDGGIFAFGDAPFFGSTGGEAIGLPVVGMAVTPSGNGYWMATASGAIFSFGHAAFEGSLRYLDLGQPVVGISATADGGGYWLAAADGGVFAFGDAGYFGRASALAGQADGII